MNEKYVYQPKVHIAEPGEIQMKNWISEQRSDTGLTKSAIVMRLKRGKYPNLTLRRVNQRVVFVRVNQ
jgi:hypothetical protein